jgi:hypothetical protein
MATAMFAEMLDNSQHSTRLIPESRSFTMNSSRENLRTRTTLLYLKCHYFTYLHSRHLGIPGGGKLTNTTTGYPLVAWCLYRGSW